MIAETYVISTFNLQLIRRTHSDLFSHKEMSYSYICIMLYLLHIIKKNILFLKFSIKNEVIKVK